MTIESNPVADHYTLGGLGDQILDALRRMGKDLDNLTSEDLAPVDEFHIRGRAASAELAKLAGVTANMHVLDVGSGLGGPARHLADVFGCRVTGIDLTGEFCSVARMLSERTGLSHRVAFHRGDALDMPFDDAGFDLVWTQHAAMNIADKPALYAEILRVLKPGGRFAVYDIVAGPGGGIHFPVPWAPRSELSFLVTQQELRALLESAGFRVLEWRDVTGPSRQWYRALVERSKTHGLPPLSIQMLFGPGRATIVRNQVKNFDQNRIELVQAVAERPA
ncbi:MAG: class I SAM-dependent methyltransferase [Alphaproteobacteria bacterium]